MSYVTHSETIKLLEKNYLPKISAENFITITFYVQLMLKDIIIVDNSIV